jgi:AbrB family looped-hinge helix DNA binding protein
MSIVKIKNKYQVVIPEHVRADVGVQVGDTFEVKAERGKIVFTPKSLIVVDREIALGLEDVRKGRTYGPFKTADEMISSMQSQLKKRKTGTPKTKRLR